MTILLELRELAKRLRTPSLAMMVRSAADEIDVLVDDLHDNPTTENMTRLNGAWAVGVRILECQGNPEQGPRGGALREDAELQRIAA